ncbi:hypothetical protein [uncultured Roseobacter sp.]|uniref:hypothetical protein n=1 Tax=uncultured Roseobacter sp. TaxID=114847 RepID=UPI0026039E12|nr:hypothetical protein [uncultured Roseobacter sp.]
MSVFAFLKYNFSPECNAKTLVASCNSTSNGLRGTSEGASNYSRVKANLPVVLYIALVAAHSYMNTINPYPYTLFFIFETNNNAGDFSADFFHYVLSPVSMALIELYSGTRCFLDDAYSGCLKGNGFVSWFIIFGVLSLTTASAMFLLTMMISIWVAFFGVHLWRVGVVCTWVERFLAAHVFRN